MTKQTSRICQPCSACCDGWVQMVIRDTPVYPGKPCPHSTGGGCDDYENRPEDPCHHFNCGWILDNSPLPLWMKPDNGKVIVLFNKFTWNGSGVDLAVPVGRRIPPRALNWLKGFSSEHRRPLVYTEQVIVDGVYQKQQELIGYGPPAFQEDMRLFRSQGKRLW
ncbi:MAG: hypothetical protein EA372_12665 [Chromatiaceae bacterium]|nr:MAG: hypothetical protein EA372_12665 [Chromatiaceae bacterium]